MSVEEEGHVVPGKGVEWRPQLQKKKELHGIATESNDGGAGQGKYMTFSQQGQTTSTNPAFYLDLLSSCLSASVPLS